MFVLSVCLILVLLLVIIIPIFIYTFFFQKRQQSPNNPTSSSSALNDKSDLATVVVVAENGGECPICLSVLEEEEELWRLNLCNHLFHAPCIERWLNAHSDCPVCRANVKPPPPPKRSLVVPAREARDDRWQGMPDSAGLV